MFQQTNVNLTGQETQKNKKGGGVKCLFTKYPLLP